MKKFLTLIITCFLSLSLAGCSNSKNNDDILTFFDALGNTLNLKSPNQWNIGYERFKNEY